MSAGAPRRHITVLSGGWSAEREVSLVTGAGVAAALRERGHRVDVFDPPPDPAAIAAGLNPLPDLVFNALHGAGGEDGVIQAVLGLLGLPYTHSGVTASAVAMNKPLAKRVVASAGVRCPAGLAISRARLAAGHPMEPPYVVKPIGEGSSVGVTIVWAGADPIAVPAGADPAESLLVEPYIRGRELTVAAMSRPGDAARALAVTEIVYTSELFDFTVKYSAGHATHILPAQIPESVYALAMDYARLAHDVIGCTGVTRSDFRWDDSRPDAEGLFFLEINTQPGMTPISLAPEQAALIGMSYGDLVEWIAEAALWRR
jgi:D-alanine-D-alanine ligase